MRTKHRLTAWAPFGLQPDSLECVIEYTYTPGARATRIDPADPAEVDLISVKLVHHPINDAMQAMLDDWASEYLSTDGYSDACENAEDSIDDQRETARAWGMRA